MVLSLWPVVAAGKAKGKSDGRKDQTTSGHTGEERRGGVWGGSKSSGGDGQMAGRPVLPLHGFVPTTHLLPLTNEH